MDKMRKVTREYRTSQWSKIIKECRNSGQTIKAWCEENGIGEKAYYYWQRKFRESVCQVIEATSPKSNSLPAFVEISLTAVNKSESVAITLRIGEIAVEVRNGAEPTTIDSVIRILKELC